MAFGLRWAGTGVFLATEVRVQFHEWLAIVTGTLTPGALLIFVAVLAPDLIAVTLIGSLVYSMFLIGQRVLNEAAYIRIDHKLNELYHASPLSPRRTSSGSREACSSRTCPRACSSSPSWRSFTRCPSSPGLSWPRVSWRCGPCRRPSATSCRPSSRT